MEKSEKILDEKIKLALNKTLQKSKLTFSSENIKTKKIEKIIGKVLDIFL